MNLKKIVSKSIASFMVTVILFGNFSMCGMGISKVIAENISAPETEIQIENQKYVQYSYTEIVQEEIAGENEGETVMQDVEKQIAGVAVQSKLSVKPIQVAETYLPTQSVNLSVNLPRINEFLPVRAIVVTASTKYTTGEESKNINQSYDATTGLLSVSYENVSDEEGNIYANFNENTKDEFEIIYIYPAEAYVGNETDTLLNYTVYAEITFVTENDTVQSIVEQSIELTEKENKEDISSFRVTNLKENIYKGFMYSNIENKTSHDTDFSTVSTFAVLNSDIAKEVLVEENANQLILKGDERVVVSANENVVYNSTTILKAEFDRILGQENSFVEFYQGEEIYATVRYIDIDETKKIAIIYKDAEPIILEDGENEIVVNYPENTIALKIKISKPVAEGFINFENKNRIKAAEDYGYEVKDVKSILVTTNINEDSKEAELKLLEPSTKVSINSSNSNFSTLQQSSTTLTINLDDTSITTKLFNSPRLTVKLPKGIEKFDVTNVDILNGNGLSIEGYEAVNNTIVIQLSGVQTDFDFNNVSGGVNIVVDINNIDYSDIIPTHSDKIELICSQDNAKAECGVNIVSKPGLLTLANLSGYDNNGSVITNVDNTVKVAQVSVKQEAKEALYTLDLVNNYDENLTNVQILGKIGYSNNELSSTFETRITRPIEISDENAKVYYSTNVDASYEDDSWQEEYTSQAKIYKVVLSNNEMQKARHISLKEYIQIPENLNVNETSYLNVNLVYNYKDVVMQDNLVIGMETAKDELQVNSEQVDMQIYSLDRKQSIPVSLNVTPMISQEYVHSKQLVTYKIEVTNNGDEDLTNLELKDIIPDNAIYTYKQEIEDPTANYFQLTENPDLKEFVWEIEALRAGETREFEIMLTMSEVSEEQEIVNEVSLISNGQSTSVESRLLLKPASISVRLTTLSEAEEAEIKLKSGDIIEYHIKVENITENKLRNIDIQYEIPEGMQFVEGGLGRYGDTPEDYGYNIAENGNLEENIFKYTINNINSKEKEVIVVRCKVLRREDINKYSINSIAKVNVDNNLYESNTKTIDITQPEYTITLESNIEENKILKAKDAVNYIIKVKNIGMVKSTFNILDNIPEEIEINAIKYFENQEEPQELAIKRQFKIVRSLEPNEILTIIIEGEIKEITVETNSIIEANNIVTLKDGDYELKSNNIILKIQPEVKVEEEDFDDLAGINPEDPEDDGKEDFYEEGIGDDIPNLDDKDDQIGSDPTPTPDLEQPGQPEQPEQPGQQPGDNNPQTPTPEPTINRYSISGKAWLDLNKNGQKDSDEKTMENIQVTLVDKATGKYALDEAGNKITTTTNSNGEYKFENVKEGTYVVVFEIDTNKYVLTTYQKTNVNQDVNSDAILTKLNIDGQNTLAGMTDKIELKSDKVNIDIGLMENAIFDLSLEKVITKITVINAKGTETTEYKDGETAKIDLVAKYMNGAEVIVTYKFTVKNEGDTVGYVDKLVDNLPSGLEFNSELNSNWYKGSDNQLYTTSLSGKAIKPGESTEVELVLTKKMTENNTGVFPNNAELVEISNLENIKEREDALENNKSSAMLIISIKTGSVILYTGITMISVLIIALGAYIIKKKILNRGI